MSKKVRIGTRKSPLAMWQAKKVEAELKHLGLTSTIVEITTEGDVDVETPLNDFETTGVFTKALDQALIDGEIDIAVHSLKDVPTLIEKPLVQLACVKREESSDILVMPANNVLMEIPSTGTIATSSVRRRAFWKNNFPNYKLVDIRGNVQTRIDKVNESDWVGSIFSLAGIRRLGLNVPMIKLPFMVPAPGQGTIVVIGNEKNKDLNKTIIKMDDEVTSTCTSIEREYLSLLEGGCSAPIGCHVTLSQDNFLHLHGVLLSEDGKKKVEVIKSLRSSLQSELAKLAYEETMNNGGEDIMSKIKQA